ncbi:hypothetical protein AVEN_116596-1 [Araneus ventricosus]|uniref:Uncharacterized protein n=1 Tax=Araneus ventricosus TaxID=182803 RepID=A0A4Y2DGG1_ARAVE|nr:hypothetical protein AVEN_116596-1 [Araneus ventricosus]
MESRTATYTSCSVHLSWASSAETVRSSHITTTSNSSHSYLPSEAYITRTERRPMLIVICFRGHKEMPLAKKFVASDRSDKMTEIVNCIQPVSKCTRW